MIAVLLAAILQATTPMRPIDKGLNSQIDEARQTVVRTTADWSKLWTEHAGADRKAPAVDFSKDIVLAVFMGTRSSTAFSAEIVRARTEGATLVVSYKETRPAPGGVAAQILTAPFHIVAVPKGTATDVKFERVN